MSVFTNLASLGEQWAISATRNYVDTKIKTHHLLQPFVNDKAMIIINVIDDRIRITHLDLNIQVTSIC